MTGPAQLLNQKLRRRNFFGESILWEFHSIRFGYGLDLSFNYVWDSSGRVREAKWEGKRRRSDVEFDDYILLSPDGRTL
jgi:hypothetical protein